jgi:hypothetical protein
MAYFRGLKLINDNLKKGVWKFQICQFMDLGFFDWEKLLRFYCSLVNFFVRKNSQFQYKISFVFLIVKNYQYFVIVII